MNVIKIESIADSVKKYIEKCIFNGKFKPGQQIKEQEVSQSLGVSRPPIREAFKILEAEGLLARKPNKGVFVAELDEKDIWEIYTLKTKLYVMGTELAFEHLSASILKKLEQIVLKMEECVASSPPDIKLYQRLNEQFHDTILDASRHQRLKKIASNLHNQVKRFSYWSLGNENHLRKSCQYHREIFEALKRKDKENAIRLTEEHVMEGLTLLKKGMKGTG